VGLRGVWVNGVRPDRPRPRRAAVPQLAPSERRGSPLRSPAAWPRSVSRLTLAATRRLAWWVSSPFRSS